MGKIIYYMVLVPFYIGLFFIYISRIKFNSVIYRDIYSILVGNSVLLLLVILLTILNLHC